MSDGGSSRGLSLSGVLLVVFVVLKLTNNVTWSWVWVLSPLWIHVSLVLFILTFFWGYKIFFANDANKPYGK